MSNDQLASTPDEALSVSVSFVNEEAPIAPRKLPRQQRSRSTVEAVLTAAEMLLDSGGPFTTNHIAHRAGVSVGSLYQYFPNKQSIIAAVKERQAKRGELMSA